MLLPTVSRPVCLGVKHPSWAYDQTVAGLLMWGANSDDGAGLPFATAAGPCQRSHSWVRVPRDLSAYFTVSVSRLPTPGGLAQNGVAQALGSLFVAPYYKLDQLNCS
jgi:hypothetical protein